MDLNELRALTAYHMVAKKDLAAFLKMNFSQLVGILNGRRPEPPNFRERVEAAIAKILERRTMQTAAARDLLPGRPA